MKLDADQESELARSLALALVNVGFLRGYHAGVADAWSQSLAGFAKGQPPGETTRAAGPFFHEEEIAVHDLLSQFNEAARRLEARLPDSIGHLEAQQIDAGSLRDLQRELRAWLRRGVH